MQKEEMVISIIAIISGTAIAITFFQSLFTLINKSLDRKNGSSELNQKFFDDYLTFKKDVLAQLDYIKTTGQALPPKSNATKPSLAMPEDLDEEIIKESPRLKNMLSQKK